MIWVVLDSVYTKAVHRFFGASAVVLAGGDENEVTRRREHITCELFDCSDIRRQKLRYREHHPAVLLLKLLRRDVGACVSRGASNPTRSWATIAPGAGRSRGSSQPRP